MYEDWTQNYDPEIREEHPIVDTAFQLPHRFIATCYVQTATNTTK